MLPTYADDIYSDDGIVRSYEHYRNIRDLGPVVELAASNALAVGRFRDVRALLLDHQRFRSSNGVALTQRCIEAVTGTTLFSDPPQHQRMRKVVARPLMPQAVEQLRSDLQDAADVLIERLVERRAFDGVTDLAQHLPVSIVSSLVGLPEAGRESMLEWGAVGFDCIGPINDRSDRAFAKLGELLDYVLKRLTVSEITPGSWAAHIFDAAEQGTITKEEVPKLILDYVGPSLDTTILATAHLIDLFGQKPQQWADLRAHPELSSNAIEEVLRVRSPIRGFARRAVETVMLDGSQIPEGSLVVALFASANHDERKWLNPETFNIRRDNAREHVGFGVGRHTCVGQHLARLELQCLVKAMIPRIRRFEVGTPVPQLNNTLFGFSSLPVEVYP
jgi:cytochrome P450